MLAREDPNLCNGSYRCEIAIQRCVFDPESVVVCDVPPTRCQRSTCDPLTGACVTTPDHEGEGCVDADACTTDDRCVGGDCVGLARTCVDEEPCTADSCDPARGCVFTPLEGPCNDGDACTVDDHCAEGICVSAPRVCSDDEPCTTDGCDPARGCTFEANDNDCEDGDPCTVNRCAQRQCEVTQVLDACCLTDEDCPAPDEMCVVDEHRCVAVLCRSCRDDGDCGPEGNLCVEVPSGHRCGLACEEHGDCPQGARCMPQGPELAQCLPEAGDCECVSHTTLACLQGALVWQDSCGQAEELAQDCEGRGCAQGACCPAGSEEVEGVCTPVVVEDVGPGPEDVGVDGGPGDVEPPDAGVPEDLGPADVGVVEPDVGPLPGCPDVGSCPGCPDGGACAACGDAGTCLGYGDARTCLGCTDAGTCSRCPDVGSPMPCADAGLCGPSCVDAGWCPRCADAGPGAMCADVSPGSCPLVPPTGGDEGCRVAGGDGPGGGTLVPWGLVVGLGLWLIRDHLGLQGERRVG